MSKKTKKSTKKTYTFTEFKSKFFPNTDLDNEQNEDENGIVTDSFLEILKSVKRSSQRQRPRNQQAS